MASRDSRAPKAPKAQHHDDNGLRRQAREAAAQVLYALDAAGDRSTEFVEEAMRSYWAHLEGPAPGRPYGDELVRGVVAKWEQIDPMIKAANPNWRIERMARVDRNVLRMAAWEMVFGDVPPEVAINEAIELAKRFGTEDSAAFVNGTLDKLATLQGKLAPRG
jgi:N utilization substance protein B